ncbi:hypothetical protein M0R45_020563 [Rubus argutus]|uniref:Protein TIME FOR COFFEE-like n=1 Tax=Rubus argutus TaxID=59490 RepID=A0AAW1XA30_RUBAR
MDRNRDARRGTMAATNGLSRRRHRSNSLRDSPEDDGPMELQETSRLRDRGSGKKDRDRDRDRERDRDRDRDRDRLSRNKRRRGGERLMHGSNREDGGEDSSEESVNDEDEDEYDDGGGGGSIRMLPPNPPTTSLSSSASLLNHRKSFPPANNNNNNKHFRPLPALKVTDEMIGVSVPRKARSASTKRSHEWPSSCGVVGDQFHRQSSTSPVRPSTSMAAPSPAPTSPSSSHASVRKKLKPNGPKLRPPKMSTTKTSPSAQEEIEIEIAQVLYGMMSQPQGPTKQEVTATDSIKFESRDANKSTSDAKSRVSSPISNSPFAPPQLTSAFPQNSSSSVTSMSATAPKRKRPRPVKYDDEHPSIFTVQSSTISSTSKVTADQSLKIEASSPNLEKNPGSVTENGGFSYNLANSHAVPVAEAQPESIKESIKPESKAVSDSKPGNDDSQSPNVKLRKEEAQSPKKEYPGFRLDDNREDMTATNKANSTISEIENHREEKFQIDLMAPPPSRSSPERDGEVDFVSVDPKPTVTVAETELKSMTREDDKALKFGKEEPANVETDKSNKAAAVVVEETEVKKPVVGSKERNIDLQLDLEKTDRDSGNAGFSGNKLHQHVTKQQQNTEKSVQPSTVPLPISVAAGWPGGLSPMGYMAPLQGVVSMDGSTVSPAAMQPPQLLFNQPRPKRCATHCYIARNIYYHQQMSKMNPFWPVAAGSGSLYGTKHCNPNVIPSEFHGNIPGRGANSAPDKGQGLAMFPAQSGKEKASPAANLMDAAQRKQIVIQQALPPGAPSNILHGPAFIFPLSQQQAAASVRPGSVKSPNAGSAALPSAVNSASMTAAATPAVTPAMSFNYPGNEPQYLAILQNNAYPFPMPAHVGAPPAYRGPHAQALPYFSGSFYSSQMLHPSQLQQQQQQPPSQSQQSQQGHQTLVFPVVRHHPRSICKISSSRGRLPVALMVAMGACKAFLPQKTSLHKHYSSSSNSIKQQQQHQHQRQHQQNPHAPHQARQLEHEMGGEDSPSTADSRISRGNMSIYAQNIAMPMHPPNFALMTPPSMGSVSGATTASGSEKKQQQGSKAGVEASQALPCHFLP